MRLTVLPHYWWHRLVEKRQVEILDVHEFELGVAALLRDFIDPLRYRLAISTRARTSENDCDLHHIIKLPERVEFANAMFFCAAMPFQHDRIGQ